jgi:hypothetical protein
MLIDRILSNPCRVVALSLMAGGHIQFGVHSGSVVACDVAYHFVATGRQVERGPTGRAWGNADVVGLFVTFVWAACP